MDHTKAKIAKPNDDNDFGSIKHDDAKLHLDASEKANVNDERKSDDQYIKKDSDTADKILDDSGSPQLPPISRKVDDESDEPVIPKLLGLYFSLLITFINCCL